MNNKELRVRFPFLFQVLIAFSCFISPLSTAQQANLAYENEEARAEALAYLPARDGIYQKVAHDLVALQQNYLSTTPQKPAKTLDRMLPMTKFMGLSNNYVVVDAIASGNAAELHSDLLSLGAQNVASYGQIVSATFPIGSIDMLGGLDSLRYVRPSYSITNVGDVTSQGDAAQASDTARTNEGVDGSGVTVGILSDSFNCLPNGTPSMTEDIASGDLPAAINIIQDNCPATDEGRGMGQLIFDVAPGSALAFSTASGGQAVFANSIDNLVAQGANVIVDDVLNFGEPMFMNGSVAQAAQNAYAAGRPFFSSAGNSDTDSYQSPFVERGLPGIFGLVSHDFDPGPGQSNLQQLTIPPGAGFSLIFQWNQPFFSVTGGPGATTDLNIYVIGADMATPLAAGISPNLASGDPLEIVSFSNTGFDLDGIPGNDTTFYIFIENVLGPNPTEMKYVYFDSNSGVTIDTFVTNSSTSYGHNNAAGAEAIGAAFYGDTPAFGTNPPALESFSSRGDTPIHHDDAGVQQIPPIYRQKVEVTGPDGGNTTFFGNDIGFDADAFPNFFGTSASAPHVAGIAALLLEANPGLTPDQIYGLLEDSAINIPPPGFDNDSGHGLVQADIAFNALDNTPPTLSNINSAAGVTGDNVVFNFTYSDTETSFANMTLSQTGTPGCCTLIDNGDGTGSIDCNITANDTGRFAINLKATDRGDDAVLNAPNRSANTGAYLVANENTEPVITLVNNQTMDDGTQLVIPLSGMDADAGQTLTFSSSNAPGFCVVNNTGPGVGDVTCNPGFNNTGIYVMTALVSDDGVPNKAKGTLFALTIDNVNRPPVLDPIGPQDVDEGVMDSLQLTASDPDNTDTLFYTIDNLPSFCGFVDNGDGTADVTCSPSFDDAGVYPGIEVTVTDDGVGGALSDSETVTLTVNDINRNPVLDFIGNHTFANNAANYVINIEATDADGDTITLSNALPLFCVSNYIAGNPATGTITCNPGGAGDNGTDSVTVTATDDGAGLLTDDETFDIVVGDPGTVNLTPVLDPVGNQMVEDTKQLVIPLTSNDPDGDNMTFATNTSGVPAFCVLNDGNGNGDITCNPAFGDAGVYPIGVRVTDDGTPNLTDTEKINLTVVHINVAPVADAGPDQNLPTLTPTLLDGTGSTDLETPTGMLTYSWRFVAIAFGSTLTDANISNRFTANAGFTPDVDGTYTLELSVTDGDGGVDVDTVTIEAQTPKVLYYIDELNNRISPRNTATGLTTFGDVGMNLPGNTVNGGSGIAVHPQTNEMFAAIRINGVGTTRELVTIVPGTGLATSIGDMGDVVQGLTFDANGTLYAVTGDPPGCPAVATTAETLFTVDTSTGAMTFEQTLGDGGCNEAIAYNPTDDTIYHLSGSGLNVFESIDLVGDTEPDIALGPGAPTAFTAHGLVYDPAQAFFLGVMINFDSGNLEFFSLTSTGTFTIITSPVEAMLFEWRGHTFWDPNFEPPTSVAANGDHTADGNADFLWRNGANGQNALWEQTGATRDANTPVPAVANTDWQVVGDGDYDGMGDQDILWRNSVTGAMAIWIMDGGTLVDNISLPTVADLNWTVVSDGDHTGDGVSDIFWRHLGNGQNALWQINGGMLTRNFAVTTVADLNWVVVADGDFTGDGKDDLMWRNMANGQNALWAMDGASREFNLFVPTVGDLNWEVHGDGDANNDGMADLMWRNVANGQNALWTMNGATRTANLAVEAVTNQDWQIVSHRDFDGDGIADLAWRHATQGTVVFWGMNVNNRLSNIIVDTVSDTNWEIVDLN